MLPFLSIKYSKLDCLLLAYQDLSIAASLRHLSYHSLFAVVFSNQLRAKFVFSLPFGYQLQDFVVLTVSCRKYKDFFYVS